MSEMLIFLKKKNLSILKNLKTVSVFDCFYWFPMKKAPVNSLDSCDQLGRTTGDQHCGLVARWSWGLNAVPCTDCDCGTLTTRHWPHARLKCFFSPHLCNVTFSEGMLRCKTHPSRSHKIINYRITFNFNVTLDKYERHLVHLPLL